MKKRQRQFFFDFLLLLLILVLSRIGWFRSGEITFGDWSYAYQETIREHFRLDASWNLQQNLGSDKITYLYHLPVALLSASFARLGFGTSQAWRLVNFWPVLFVGLLGIYYLTYILFKSRVVSFFSSLLFLLNQHIFLGGAGGHLTVLMAYALFPLVLALFIQTLKKRSARYLILTTFGLAASFAYEPRFTYLTSWILAFFYFYHFLLKKISLRKKVLLLITQSRFLITPFILLFLLNFYWLVNLFVGEKPSLSPGFFDPNWIATFSYTKMPRAFDLTSIWWKDYIGPYNQGVYFIFPIIALISLLSLKWRRKILFFAGIFLISAFLVKGSNPPFGGIYYFLFRHLPGFSWFRDPGKFALPLTFSIAVLFGASVGIIFEKLKKVRFKNLGFRKFTQAVYLLLVFSFVLYSVWPIISRQYEDILGRVSKDEYLGTLRPVTIPGEYFKLKDFIKNQPDFFRVLWLPKRQRFGFYSNNHPGIDLIALMEEWQVHDKDFSERFFKNNLFSYLGVKYVIIPYDSEEDVFKYYGPKDKWLKIASSASELEKIDIIPNIVIYENEEFLPHIYTSGDSHFIRGSFVDLDIIRQIEDFPLSDGLYFSDENDLASIQDQSNLKNIFVIATPLGKPSPISIEMPYVRLLPGNPLYFYVAWKENRAEKKTRSSDELFDLKLKFAEKRLIEVKGLLGLKEEKVIGQRLDNIKSKTTAKKTEIAREAIGRYISKMEEIEILLKQEPTKSKEWRDKFQAHLNKQNHTLAEIANELNKQDKAIEIGGMLKEASEVTAWDQWVKIFGEDKPLLVPGEIAAKRFVVIPEEGEYEMFVFDEEWKSLEKTYYSKGDHEITLDVSSDTLIVLQKKREKRITKLPTLTFAMINPTKYKISVDNVTSPYNLIFNETYNKGWRLFLANSKQVLADKRHTKVNGYANSWFVKPEDVRGVSSYELVLEYTPQRLMNQGLRVSIITLLGCFGYLMF